MVAVKTVTLAGLAEPVRPLQPWSDQKFGYLWSKSCIQRVLVGPIIVKLRFFSKSRTNLALLPPLLFKDSEWVRTRCNTKQNMAKFRKEKNEGVQTGRRRTIKFAEWRRCYRIKGLGRL